MAKMATSRFKLLLCLTAAILESATMCTSDVENQQPRILLQPFEVMQSFHSHFMNSLAVFLSSYYEVSVISEENHRFTTRHISDNKDLNFIKYQTLRKTYQPVMMDIKDDGQLPMKVIQDIKSKGEEIMRMRYSDAGLLKTVREGNYSLLIYNSMDYGTAAVCQFLDIPCIQVITSGMGSVHNPYSLELVNSVPYMLSEYTDLNSLSKRIVNTLFYLSDHYMRTLYFYPGVVSVARDIGLFDRNTADSIDYLTMAAETPVSSLIYTNNAADCHATLPSSYVRIGGALLSNTTLEREFQTIMDRSIDGVIVVAFGRGAGTFNQHTLRLMIKVFGKLNHTVLWSIGSQMEVFKDTYTIPPNVYLFNSIPQNALLAHPNTQLLVTHSGQGSTTEAIYHGVPILATPLRMDQKTNAKKLTKLLGMGLTLDIRALMAQELYTKIQHILSTNEYKTNAIMASHAFRQCDRYPERNILNTIKDAINSPVNINSDRKPKHWVQLISVDVLIIFSSLPVIVFLCLVKCCTIRQKKV